MADESRKYIDVKFLKDFYRRLPSELNIPNVGDETNPIDWTKEITIAEEENNG